MRVVLAHEPGRAWPSSTRPPASGDLVVGAVAGGMQVHGDTHESIRMAEVGGLDLASGTHVSRKATGGRTAVA
jgi:hypothetical protein